MQQCSIETRSISLLDPFSTTATITMSYPSRFRDVLSFTKNSKGQLINSQCLVCKNKPVLKGYNGYRHARKFHPEYILPYIQGQGGNSAAAGHGQLQDAAATGWEGLAATAAGGAAADATAAAGGAAAAAAVTGTAAAAATEQAGAAAAAAAEPGIGAAPELEGFAVDAAADALAPNWLDSECLSDTGVSDAADWTSDSSEPGTDGSSDEPDLLAAFDEAAFHLDAPDIPSDDGYDSADTPSDGTTADSDSPQSAQAAKEGTTAWYKQNLDQPLYPQPPGSQSGGLHPTSSCMSGMTPFRLVLRC
jgi:hypothetical protein